MHVKYILIISWRCDSIIQMQRNHEQNIAACKARKWNTLKSRRKQCSMYGGSVHSQTMYYYNVLTNKLAYIESFQFVQRPCQTMYYWISRRKKLKSQLHRSQKPKRNKKLGKRSSNKPIIYYLTELPKTNAAHFPIYITMSVLFFLLQSAVHFAVYLNTVTRIEIFVRWT